jgi:tetratricopeptide (TPR) repeat protein
MPLEPTGDLALIDALRRQLDAAPARSDLARQLARALLHAGSVEQALALLRARLPDRDAADLLREHLIGERAMPAVQALLGGLADDGSASARVDQAVRAQLEGRFTDAIEFCQQALRLRSDCAPAHNHWGRARHMLGQTEPALQQFRRAIELDPDYPEAWNNAGHALRALGQPLKACECFEHALQLAPMARTPRLNLGITRYAAEQPEAAYAALQMLIARDPNDAEALTNAGLALHLLGRIDAAFEHYQRALRQHPDDPTTLYYLGVLCSEAGQFEQAQKLLQRALSLQPQDADAWAELAALHETANRLDASGQAVQRGLAANPQHPQLNLQAAKLERRAGRVDVALQRLRRIDPRRLPSRIAQQYHFELGDLLDRAGETDAAYQAFVAGNQLAAQGARRRTIDPEAFVRDLRAMRHWAAQGHWRQPPAAEDDDGRDLCFLIGFPRSGTTLLDTMLDAHPGVASVEEKPTLEAAIAHARTLLAGFPDGLETLDPGQRQALRATYRRALAEHLPAANGRRVLDKLPMRTVDAALIHWLFPAARLLFAKRHPCDVVLSNFMQQYAANQAFVHFDSLAESVHSYDEVLSLWREIEPHCRPWLCYVSYESLVADPAAELARVCAFLDLPWNEEMLDPARRGERGAIRTNSYHQVVEPLYQRALARWERYRTYFAPYADTLRPHAEFLGYRLDMPT